MTGWFHAPVPSGALGVMADALDRIWRPKQICRRSATQPPRQRRAFAATAIPAGGRFAQGRWIRTRRLVGAKILLDAVEVASGSPAPPYPGLAHVARPLAF